MTLHFKLNSADTALSLGLCSGDSNYQKWAQADLIIMSVRIRVTGSNAVTHFLLHAQIICYAHDSVLPLCFKSNSDSCLYAVKGQLADWAALKFVLRCLKFFAVNNPPYQRCCPSRGTGGTCEGDAAVGLALLSVLETSWLISEGRVHQGQHSSISLRERN